MTSDVYSSDQSPRHPKGVDAPRPCVLLSYALQHVLPAATRHEFDMGGSWCRPASLKVWKEGRADGSIEGRILRETIMWSSLLHTFYYCLRHHIRGSAALCGGMSTVIVGASGTVDL
jgi:hypothetical protein